MDRMGKNDHAVIEAVLAGDKDAYGALVVRHSESLFRVAFRITRNEADADDVVQGPRVDAETVVVSVSAGSGVLVIANRG
jgi:RNA polymerase sigma-70 factor (ECF subfamily)